jgi:archaellum component FlaG (FlaF/FlaG flagellin family)
MKIIVLLLLIIFTSNAFSQTYGDSSSGKFDKMSDLANHNKDDEAKKIADELLSGKYGELSGFEKFFALLVVADYYYQKDDYQKASDSYQQFLDFNKNENPKKIDNKKIYIDEAKGKLAELKPKLALASTITTNTAEVTDAAKDEPNKTSETKSLDVNIAAENSSIETDKKETNTDKTVTLTVSGTGKTIEEARLNALRSAIEQAFGAFISSKTEILNDNLVKDEIVSIASGNVQKYNVVSQIEIPNTGYAITLSATVSISKLTSFAESKGVVVEFKGGMFAANMKLQKINEESELIAIKKLTAVSFELLKKSFDYELVVSEPKAVNNSNENYEISFDINTKENQNYDNFKNYFISTIQNIAINNEEYENLNKIGKKVKYLFIDKKIYKLRNEISADILAAFFISTQHILTDFRINSNLGELSYKKRELFLNYVYLSPKGEPQFYISKENTLLYSSALQFIPDVIKQENPSEEKLLELYWDRPSTKYAVLLSIYCEEKLDDKTFDFKTFDTLYDAKYLKEKSINNDSVFFNNVIFFDTKFNSPKFTIKKIFNISELQKIDAFKIEQKSFN